MNWSEIKKLGWLSKDYATLPPAGKFYTTGKHTGTDIVLKNDNVPSFTNGTVVKTAYSNGYGNYVVVKNNDGFYTYYAHLNNIKAKVGQTVKIGDILGIQGSTGQVTGKHLHLEVRQDMNDMYSTVSPDSYFSSDGWVKNIESKLDSNRMQGIGIFGTAAETVQNISTNFLTRTIFILTGIFLLYVAITRGMFGDRG